MEKIQFSKRAIISIVAIGLVGVTVGGSTVITSCSKPRLEMKEIDVRYSLSSTFNNRVSGQLSSSEYATMGFTTIDDKQPKGNGIINVDDTFFGYNKNFYIGFWTEEVDDLDLYPGIVVSGEISLNPTSIQVYNEGEIIKDVSVWMGYCKKKINITKMKWKDLSWNHIKLDVLIIS